MPTKLDRMVGLRLRELRKLRGFTRADIAASLNRDAPGVAVNIVKNLESGRTTMSVEQLLVLAQTLQVAPVALLEDVGRAGKAGQADNGFGIVPARSGGFSKDRVE